MDFSAYPWFNVVMQIVQKSRLISKYENSEKNISPRGSGIGPLLVCELNEHAEQKDPSQLDLRPSGTAITMLDKDQLVSSSESADVHISSIPALGTERSFVRTISKQATERYCDCWNKPSTSVVGVKKKVAKIVHSGAPARITRCSRKRLCQ